MKTIGMVGGTGWISSAEYYRIINEETNRRLGGLEFARCILFSVNYGEIDTFNRQNNREGTYMLILDASSKLVGSGADCIVLCANTLHQFVERLEQEVHVPVIHIAEATARELIRSNIKKIGLLGTKQTMEMDFYKDILRKYNLDVLVPELSARDFIQDTISDELLKGVFSDKSRLRLIEICNDLNKMGAEGIVMGCTEIPLLLRQENVSVPLFDTLTIHAMAAVDFALSPG